jgi:hypothetical protein
MKKIVLAAAVAVTSLAILLPVICSVNLLVTIPTSQPVFYRADGAPMPPPIPHSIGSVTDSSNDSSLVADGAPMPPPIPHSIGSVTDSSNDSSLVADGAPMPPPIPHSIGDSLVIA